MITLEREDWFPTPLWNTYLNEITDEDEINAINFCKQLQSTSEGRQYSNIGGWQSQDYYEKDLVNTPLNKYVKMLLPILSKCLEDLGSKRTIELQNFWININKKGDYNRRHIHQLSVLSGVFYLTKNNSDIVFERNVGIPTYFLENIDSDNNTVPSYRLVSFTPINRVLYVFPSWLYHSVDPSTEDTDRISIAFNTRIR